MSLARVVADTPLVSMTSMPPAIWGTVLGPFYVGDWGGLEVFHRTNNNNDSALLFAWAPGPPSGPILPANPNSNANLGASGINLQGPTVPVGYAPDRFDIAGTAGAGGPNEAVLFVRAKGTWVYIMAGALNAQPNALGSLEVICSNRVWLPMVASTASGEVGRSGFPSGVLLNSGFGLSVPANTTTTLTFDRFFAGPAIFTANSPTSSGGNVQLFAAQAGRVGVGPHDLPFAVYYNTTANPVAPVSQAVYVPPAVCTARLANGTGSAFVFQVMVTPLEAF